MKPLVGRAPDPLGALHPLVAAAPRTWQRGAAARAGTSRPKGRTRDQLYEEAKNLRIEGRSSMNKAQLQRAIAGKKS